MSGLFGMAKQVSNHLLPGDGWETACRREAGAAPTKLGEKNSHAILHSLQAGMERKDRSGFHNPFD